VTDNAAAWDRYATAYQEQAALPTDVAHYGPDAPTETDLHLLGSLRGKRVLDLGCGGAQASIAFARQGAIVTGVDFSAGQLGHARHLAEAEAVKVEFRLGDLADLAFLRSDSVDLVFSANAFGFVEDLGRVFRQVHRVLKVGAPFVFSIQHPVAQLIDEEAEQPLLIRRSYFDRSPLAYRRDEVDFTVYPHNFADVYMGLVRASYKVETVIEPGPPAGGPRSAFWRDAFAHVPRILILKARKEGN